MKKQAGFTLIELVIVIIILGILAATAVPKFIDLQGDARESSLKGVKAALEGGATLTYSVAAIEGIEKQDSATTRDGVEIAFGYPTADDEGIMNAIGLDESDWTSISHQGVTTISGFAGSGARPTTGCNVTYTELDLSRSDVRPTITIDDSEC